MVISGHFSISKATIRPRSLDIAFIQQVMLPLESLVLNDRHITVLRPRGPHAVTLKKHTTQLLKELTPTRL